uniref:Putative secreted protein n=1 Tax=Ixodes ricinus TaxID=34613 RepID=A0A6B0UCF9_IXORI
MVQLTPLAFTHFLAALLGTLWLDMQATTSMVWRVSLATCATHIWILLPSHSALPCSQMTPFEVGPFWSSLALPNGNRVTSRWSRSFLYVGNS